MDDGKAGSGARKQYEPPVVTSLDVSGETAGPKLGGFNAEAFGYATTSGPV